METYENSLHVTNSVFVSLTNTGNGGAIYISNDYSGLFIASCLFSYCVVQNVDTSYGGAIYYYSKYQEFISKKLCCTHCVASLGSFLYVLGSEDSQYLRSFNLSMYSSCSNSSTYGNSYSCYFRFGIGKAKDINGTDCCSTTGVFEMRSQKESSFSYGCFARNQGSTVFALFYTKSESILSFTLFLSCSKEKDAYGVIHYNHDSEVKLIVTNCTLINNFKPYFDLYNKGSMDVTYCTMDENSANSNRARLPSSNNIIFIDKDSFISPFIDDKCDAKKFLQRRIYSRRVVSIIDMMNFFNIILTIISY